MMHLRAPRVLPLTVLYLLLTVPSIAQEEADEEKQLGLTNSLELSLVATYGNAETETFGFKDTLRYHWPKARYSLRLEAVRSNTADDKFVLVDLGAPSLEEAITLVEPEKTRDVEKYLIENKYDRQVTERLYWNVGLTWDRNVDAGILNRYVAFAGVGNIWWDRDNLYFDTSYGLSYTDREEETPDPLKDDQFEGFRLAWAYWNDLGKITRIGNDTTFNVNLGDAEDWTGDMTTWVNVALNSRLALRVSLQWLYNNLPALQEIEVLAIGPNGLEIDFGDIDIRKDELDTVFNTSIVINF